MKKIILLLIVLALTLSGCVYIAPEGYTKEYHTYEEALEYAKSIDDDANVSETHIDIEDEYGREHREWDAVICGIECHVGSSERWVWNEGIGAGEFAKAHYVLDTDYDYYLLKQITEEKQPNWTIDDDSAFNRYQPNDILSVNTSYTKRQKLSDVELETAWTEAYEIYKEYTSHPVKKEAKFYISSPALHSDINGENQYLKISSTAMFDFSVEGKLEFLSKYNDAWNLVEEGYKFK